MAQRNGLERVLSVLYDHLRAPSIMIAREFQSSTNYGTMHQSADGHTPALHRPRRASLFAPAPPSTDGYFDIEATYEYDRIPELIPIPYSRLMFNFTLVPLFSITSLALFIAIPYFWPTPDSPDTHFPLTEFVVGFAAWIIAYALRTPAFIFSTAFTRYVNPVTTILSIVVGVMLEESVRLCAILILGITLSYHTSHPEWVPYPNTQDPAFRQIWWLALGWATGVELYALVQIFGQLVLYKDLLVDPDVAGDIASEESSVGDGETVQSHGRQYVSSILKATSPPERHTSPEMQSPASAQSSRMPLLGVFTTAPTSTRAEDLSTSFLDQEMAALMAMKARTEVEAVYGCPPPNIPVFVFCLQRLDSLLLNLGLSLILSARLLTAFVRHPLNSDSSSSIPDFAPTPDIPSSLLTTMPTLIIIIIIHSCLSILWAEALPTIGVHSASYAALLIALGLFFAGLGFWGALA